MNKTTQDVLQNGRPVRMRSPAEINAKYVKGIEQYKQLMASKNDPREQRLMLYNEIKALGWVLGKSDQTINIDLNE